MTTLIDFPNLPVLPMDKCFAVFKHAKIPILQVSNLSGFTRAALYKWMHNKSEPLPHSQDRVSVLAYRTLRSLKAGMLPLPDRGTTDRILGILTDSDKGKPLHAYTPEELLPKSWMTQLNNKA